jgi:hypothetical protein
MIHSLRLTIFCAVRKGIKGLKNDATRWIFPKGKKNLNCEPVSKVDVGLAVLIPPFKKILLLSGTRGFDFYYKFWIIQTNAELYFSMSQLTISLL